MTKPFNPKHYTGQNRIFKAVSGARDIQRIWCWDAVKKQYSSPVTGCVFLAKRYDQSPLGGKKRVSKTFADLAQARLWQNKLTLPENFLAPEALENKDKGPLFQEVYQTFWARKVSKLSTGTQDNHRRYAKCYLYPLMKLPIRAITSGVIDDLLDMWRSDMGKTMQSKQRIGFKHEISALRSVLIFYREYYDDALFYFPLKLRHAKDAIIRKASPRHKDLNEDEFLRFCEKLAQGKWGDQLVPLAIVQYYQALRISEVAALRFEDLNLNFQNPQESSIRIVQHVVYPRVGGAKPQIVEGYKNSKCGEIKELPLFYPAFKALVALYKIGVVGLIFGKSQSEPFPYRVFQAAYNKAFERAQLPYRSTHVLRHGGTRRVYNATHGDLAIAQQLLGNTDLKSTLIYAQRDKGALRKVVKTQWVHCNLNVAP